MLKTPEKLRRWMLVVAEVPPGQQIPPLPTLKIQDYSLPDILTIKALYHMRRWEYCTNGKCNRTGTDFKMKACAGCTKLPRGSTRYCSRACQRADWPRHKKSCEQPPLNDHETLEDASSLNITPEVFINCLKRSTKRREGLAKVCAWAFEFIYATVGGFDLQEGALSIYCRSLDRGRGRIVPITYQLERIANSAYREDKIQYLRDQYPRKCGIVQIYVDNVYHEPVCVSFEEDITNIQSRIPYQLAYRFWPWIFATIALMGNTDHELALHRLHVLFFVVEALARAEWPALSRFKEPKRLGIGDPWNLPDIEEWQSIFGRVVGF